MGSQRHLRLSLAVVAGFIVVGVGLEAMYGMRGEGFMHDALRREFLRLGHAHGGVLGILNLVLASAMTKLVTPESWARLIRVAALLGALMVGLGFAGGGLWHGATDPGPLVLAVPAGAMMVIAALIAVAMLRGRDP